MTARDPADVAREIDALVDRYRARCLWDMAPDYYPRTAEQRHRVLDRIARIGDRDAFRAVARLRSWLSPPPNGTSAA